ncbi:hypothetical protein COO59_12985 [Mixta theicola]|uniref:Flagellar hook-length control protein-like C-terminal domain-containing protein n=1 Tax=Mixta theicola TaxID=1458355 RepID=A0A2K1Q819_9GAMM|nr:flagellar hook-length control protein FliK [Mixta theicola]PNS11183.1 hypothetical protein COO59_12985 [Mixta theicola]GLR07554.1 flagellar hook-length control protein [Mixta theicola]
MMINMITALPGRAPTNAASADMAENADFASELDIQLAGATDEAVLVTQVENEREASDKLDEAVSEAVAAWLMPASLTEAVAASLPSASLTGGAPTAPQMSRLTGAEGTLNIDADAPQPLLESAAPQTGRHNAAAEMLRMITSPQTAHHTEKPAEAQQSHAQAVFIKPAVTTVQNQEAENDNAVLPVESRSQAMPLTAAPAFTPASLAAPAAATPAANVMLPVVHGTLEPEVGSSAWQQALGQQLSSFTRHGVHHAELRLHPENLGPLQINLRLKQDQVQLHFVTDQQPVRAALEAAMPHLRTSLADAGIQLDQGSVGRDAPSWGSAADSHSGQSSHSRKESGGSALNEVDDEIVPQRIHSRVGISIFA